MPVQVRELAVGKTGIETGLEYAGSSKCAGHRYTGLKTGKGTGKVHAGSRELP